MTDIGTNGGAPSSGDDHIYQRLLKERIVFLAGTESEPTEV